MLARRLAVAALLLVPVGGFAACGGGDDRLSEDDFLDQANDICEEANDDVDDALEDVDFLDVDESAEALLEDAFPIFRQQLDDLAELQPPSDLEEDFQAYLDQAAEDGDDLEEALEDDPEDALGSSEDPFEDSNELADDLDLDECGSDGDSSDDDSDDDDSDDEGALSEGEWVEQADAICSAGDEALDEAIADAGFDETQVPDADEFAELVLDVQIPNIEDQLDAVDDLEEPDSISADVDELLSTARDALDELRELAEDDPEALLDTATSGEDPFAELGELAEGLGLQECGSN